MELHQILVLLNSQLKEKGFHPNQMFNEGITDKYMDQVMGTERTPMQKDIVDLYAWHNGSPLSEGTYGEVTLFCGSVFIPFEYSWLSYRHFKSDQFFINRKLHFPFMQDGSGVFLFIDGDESSATKNMIYEYDISRFPGPYELKFESITALVSGTLECLNNDIYKRNFNGQIDVDFEKQHFVFRKHNSSIPYWQK